MITLSIQDSCLFQGYSTDTIASSGIGDIDKCLDEVFLVFVLDLISRYAKGSLNFMEKSGRFVESFDSLRVLFVSAQILCLF